MRALIFPATLVFIIACAPTPEPRPNIPLPPDEPKETIIHKNVQDIRLYSDCARGIAVKDKDLIFIHAWEYKVVVDATDEPWWEEISYYKHFWRQLGGRWEACSQTQFTAIIHIKSIKDITVDKR